jgi:hypothetical protein
MVPSRHGNEGGDKLAKLHGSIPYSALRAFHTPAALCGLLAHGAGLLDAPRPCTPAELVAAFAWDRVPREDRVATLTDNGLAIG